MCRGVLYLAMIVSDQQREENYQEYLRLKADSNYYDVYFDEYSGGFIAIHKEHMFDKQVGPFGYSRGRYEIDIAYILERNGHSVILESEYPNGPGIKTCDATIDGFRAEFKTIESVGRWTIRTKIADAVKQGAEIVVLYFPDSIIYSKSCVLKGWREFISYFNKQENIPVIQILCLVDKSVLRIEKPSW